MTKTTVYLVERADSTAYGYTMNFDKLFAKREDAENYIKGKDRKDKFYTFNYQIYQRYEITEVEVN